MIDRKITDEQLDAFLSKKLEEMEPAIMEHYQRTLTGMLYTRREDK